MVSFVLVRHGDRERNDPEDSHTPLSAAGRASVLGLARRLSEFGVRPDVVITSKYQHALETAQILARALSGEIVPVGAFTPHDPGETLPQIIAEAKAAGADLLAASTVVFVGHEPRLSQLTQALTSQQSLRLEYAEARGIEADTFGEFLAGRASIVRTLQA
jgi:phosphohistidine phosphatase SixA